MDSETFQHISGVSFVGVTAVTILGITTAEALFPGYSTSGNTISALGAARGTPESRAVFNIAMVLSGGLLAVAAYGLHRVYDRRLLTGVVAITGVGGFVGVGLFPSQAGPPHFIAAMIAFVGVGLSALVVATTIRGPFRYVSATLGVLELIALVLFVALGDSTPLGIGGLERWVAYLGLTWGASFGGFLLADGPPRSLPEPSPWTFRALAAAGSPVRTRHWCLRSLLPPSSPTTSSRVPSCSGLTAITTSSS